VCYVCGTKVLQKPSMLQSAVLLTCVAVCCSAVLLTCVAVCCSAVQCVAVRCTGVTKEMHKLNVGQCAAVCCSVLQCA